MGGNYPKVLLEVAGQPVISHVLQAASALRPKEIVTVVAPDVHPYLLAIIEGENSEAAVQKKPLGTADAVRAGLSKLKAKSGTLIVLVGDAPLIDGNTLKNLLREHQRQGAKASILSFEPDDPTGYGRVIRDENGKALRITEHRDLPPHEQSRWRECNSGVWAVDIAWLRGRIGRINSRNKAKEFYLTDLFEMAAAERKAAAVLASDPDCCVGINTPAELAQAAALLWDRKLSELLESGVLISDPASTFVDVYCKVGTGTRLHPGVHLQGDTQIGKNCEIGVGCVIRDSRIADGAEIHPYSVIEDAIIGPNAQIGPFARLRPGSQIAKGAKVGNFVELKKTRLGPGSKANHLSYLGDAEIAGGVNIGAGTITCNYDGKDKHVTTIGEGVFVGSDTQLVAPVRVGKGAYIASGTTVTRNVPAGALAIARTEQTNVANWRSKKKTASKKRPVKKSRKRR